MPHGTRAQAGPKQHYNTNNPYIHTHKKTVDLDNVSFTYIVYNSVYNSVKGLQSIGSSVWHYVPKLVVLIVSSDNNPKPQLHTTWWSPLVKSSIS